MIWWPHPSQGEEKQNGIKVIINAPGKAEQVRIFRVSTQNRKLGTNQWRLNKGNGDKWLTAMILSQNTPTPDLGAHCCTSSTPTHSSHHSCLAKLACLHLMQGVVPWGAPGERCVIRILPEKEAIVSWRLSVDWMRFGWHKAMEIVVHA